MGTGPLPADSREAKAFALEADVEKAWVSNERHPRELHYLCTQWVPKWMHELRPHLKQELQLCAAVAQQRMGNADAARKQAQQLIDAIDAAPLTASSQRVRAEAMTLLAQLDHAALRDFNACGTKLGLSMLRGYEAEALQVRAADVNRRYRQLLDSGDPLQVLEAMTSMLEVQARLMRLAYLVPPTSFRGVALPSPFTTDKLTIEATSQQLAQKARWLNEFDRFAQKANAQLALVDDDQGLPHRNVQRAQLKQRLQAMTALRTQLKGSASSTATSPWASRWSDGLLASGRDTGYVRQGGRWVETPSAQVSRKAQTAVASLKARLLPATPAPDAAPIQVTLADAYALAAADKVGNDVLQAALAHDDVVLRMAALSWVQAHPAKGHDKLLVAYWRARQAGVVDAAPFSTLQKALFSERARAYLAFLSLADKERDVALNLSYQGALPWELRTWMLAELGDTRVRYRVQELVDVPEDAASAIALYGTYRANGERSLWLMRQRRKGEAGCVAQHILQLHSLRMRPAH